MSFAVRKDGQGWRAVGSAEDCTDDENFSETQPLPAEETPEDLMRAGVEAVRLALQKAIDTKASGLGFSGGNALMLYAGFPNAFNALAIVFAIWEASVWVEAEAYKAQVIAGTKPMLSGEAAVAMMPDYPEA